MNTTEQIKLLREALSLFVSDFECDFVVAGAIVDHPERLWSVLPSLYNKAVSTLAATEAAPKRCDKGHVFSDGKCVVCDAPVADDTCPMCGGSDDACPVCDAEERREREATPIASGQDADLLAEVERMINSFQKVYADDRREAIYIAIRNRLRNAAPVPHDAVVPDGWQLVPKEPTQTMIRAMYDRMSKRGWDSKAADYDAAINAAPPAPLETASAVRERALEEMACHCEQLYDKAGFIHYWTAAQKCAAAVRTLKVKP